MMSFDEFMSQVVSVFPDAIVEQALDGELVIHTNLKMSGADTVVDVDDPNTVGI